jgi:hypothetical protein
MLTVCSFIRSNQGPRNSIISRTLRKVGVIDAKYSEQMPQHGEHWLVQIVRENLSGNGPGLFVLHPKMFLRPDQLSELQHNQYELRKYGSSIIVVPHDTSKYWVWSRLARRSIQESEDGVESVVIDHGGQPWRRRTPAETTLGALARGPLDRRA